MKNKEVNEFKKKIGEILESQKESILEQVEKHIKSFDEIEMYSFNFDSPYTGETKNKIFFTYSDHYQYNSGVSMSVGKLHHVHNNIEDRGYIKGVVTDLDGYLKLRSSKKLSHNLIQYSFIYMPVFQKSKHSEKYRLECMEFIDSGIEELDNLIIQQVKMMNNVLEEKTGCSLLYYIENI